MFVKKNDMLLLIKFIFASAGLSWIVVRSNIFKPFREYITKERKVYQALSVTNQRLRFKSHVLWFLDSILNCSGCFSFWACQPIFFLLFSFKWQEFIIHILIGTIAPSIIINFWQFLRK